MKIKTIIILSVFFLFTSIGITKAVTIAFPQDGGTGTASIPTYGKMLVGNSAGTYTLTATSSLGISGAGGEANTGSSLGTGRNLFDSKSGVDLRFNTLSAGTNITLSTTSNNNTIVINSTGGGTIDGTGSANTLTYWTDSDTVAATSSPTVGYITATSTTATSTFAGGMNVAGTAGLTVLQNGNVGVGTAEPTERLTLLSTGKIGWEVSNGVVDTNLYRASANVLKTDDEFNIETLRIFREENKNFIFTPATTLYLKSEGDAILSAHGANGRAIVRTQASNPVIIETATIERMRISSDGNVGIGTTTPYSKLSVWGAGTGTNRLFELTDSASTTLASFQENGTGYFLGNIGIGTTSPYAKLSVVGETVAEKFTATSTTATSTFKGFEAGSNGLVYDSSSGDVWADAMTTFFVDSSANKVGVGTTSPPEQFTVGGTGITRFAVFGGTSWMSFGADPTDGPFYMWNSTKDLRFAVGTNSEGGGFSEKFRMGATGNLGIGTSSPGTSLSIGNTGASTINISPTATSTFGLGLNIRGGCFAINGTCVGGAGGGSGTVTNISTTFPILGGDITTTGTLTFGGLSTSTAAVVGNIPYFTGVNTFGNVATGTISSSGGITTTASRYAIGGALSIACDIASGSIAGCLSSANWTTFNGKADTTSAMTGTFDGVDFTSGTLAQNALWVGGSAAAPSELTVGTGGFILGVSNGAPAWIATTTFSGGLLYSAGNVTNTITAGDALTRTGDDIDFDGGTVPAGSLGGSWASPTIDDLFILNTGDIGTGSYTFPNASTTNFSTSYASSTKYFGADLSACNATTGKLLWSGGVFSCGTDFNTGGGGGSDPFTHPSVGLSATTTQMLIGTSTASNYQLTVSSSTAPQLSLSAGTGVAQWTLRNAGGNLYFATTTVAGTATTTIAALELRGDGKPGLAISSSTPFATLAVNPLAGNFSNQFVVGSSSATSLRLDNSGHLFLPQLSTDAAAHTYTMCGGATTFEAFWDTTTCVLSALKYKTNIEDLDIGLEELLKVRPVSFDWKLTGDSKYDNDINTKHNQIGIIADSFAEIDSRLVTYDNNGEVRGFRYDFYTSLITAAIQDFYKEFQKLVSKVSGLEMKMNEQQKQIDELKIRLDKMEK